MNVTPPAPLPSSNHALVHNALTLVTQAYGQMLVDLERQNEFLRTLLAQQSDRAARAEVELASFRECRSCRECDACRHGAGKPGPVVSTP